MRLLSSYGADWETNPQNWGKMLKLASAMNRLDVVRFLFDLKGGSVSSRDIDDGLRAAIGSGGRVGESGVKWPNRPSLVRPNICHEVIEFLLSKGLDANRQKALQLAVDRRDLDMIRILLSHGAKMEAIVWSDNSIYCIAWAQGTANSGLANMLLEASVERDVDEKLRGRILEVAASIGHKGVMAKLIEQGRLNDGASTHVHQLGRGLHAAVRNGHRKAAEILIAHGADANQELSWGERPLSEAFRAGCTQMVGLLLDAGAALHFPYGRSPLQASAEWGNVEILRLVLDQGYGNNVQDALNNIGRSEEVRSQLLEEASSHGSEQIVRLLLSLPNNDLRLPVKGLNLALKAAVTSGHSPIVKLLLGHEGLDLSLDDPKSGRDILWQAANQGNPQIVSQLLHTDIHLSDHTIWGNALLAAVSKGHKLALGTGATLGDNGDCAESGKVSEFIKAALTTACTEGYVQIATELINIGDIEDLKTVLREGFYHAARGGHEPMVKFLLQRPEVIEQTRERFSRALLAAVKHGSTRISRLLIEQGADVNYQSYEECCALMISARGYRQNLKMIKFLLDQGACLDQKDKRTGQTPVECAVQEKHQDTVRLMLRYATKVLIDQLGDTLKAASGADMKATGGYFGTALQAASFAGRDNVVLKLLDAGAQAVSQTDGQPATAAPIIADVTPPLQLRRFVENGDLGGQATYFTALSIASMIESGDIAKMLAEEGAESETQLGAASAMLAESMRGASHQVSRSNIHNDSLTTSQENEALPKDSGPWFVRSTPQTFQDLLQEFLDDGIDINTPNGRFGNSLQAAISGGHENIAQILIDRGADAQD
ncbi:unnamed protein product [Clonostachys chloroleuca]|uniref:Uncharacterized protein n=1 Tax=Clonostachys chloroleuca TaxID=1926264 RepID=A0AA35MGR4_9HYPO|nr:unnamed protein product [Clonostachys chloroleuca]